MKENSIQEWIQKGYTYRRVLTDKARQANRECEDHRRDIFGARCHRPKFTKKN
jgi:hypothetical protein